MVRKCTVLDKQLYESSHYSMNFSQANVHMVSENCISYDWWAWNHTQVPDWGENYCLSSVFVKLEISDKLASFISNMGNFIGIPEQLLTLNGNTNG